MTVEFLAVVALVTIAYGVISGKAESRPLTPPMFFAHGVTAAPFAAWYSRRLKLREGEDLVEHREVPVIPWRLGGFSGFSNPAATRMDSDDTGS